MLLPSFEFTEQICVRFLSEVFEGYRLETLKITRPMNDLLIE